MNNKIILFLVCLFLGPFGVHRFMVGKIGTGILYFLTFGLFGFGWIYDLIKILTGNFVKTEQAKMNLEIERNNTEKEIVVDKPITKVPEMVEPKVEVEKEVIEIKKVEEPKVEEKSPEKLYLESFDAAEYYDLNKELDETFIKSITRTKEMEFEKFMKYGGTNTRPRSFVVFDLETTGLSEDTHEIIQIGAIKFDFGEPVEIFRTYIKPKKKITERITKINGITNTMVQDAPTIEEVLPKFLDFIGDNVLIAHNAPFDMKFLLKNLYDSGYKKPKNKVLDTLVLARQKVREFDIEKERGIKLTSYKLEELKWRFNLFDLKSHEALADCKVCAYVYIKIINEFGDFCYTDY